MAKLGGDNLPEKSKRGRPPGPAKPGHGLAVLPDGFVEIKEPKCKVCNCPWRREIDMNLAMGWSQAAVMRHYNQLVEEPSEEFTRQNISNHAKKHLSSRDAAVRRIYEERAKQIGFDIDEAENFIITKSAVLDTIVHQGLLSLRAGESVAEPREIIAALGMLDKLESEFRDQAVDEVMTEFRMFTEAVKLVVGEEQYEAIYNAFEALADGKKPVVTPVPQEASKKRLLEANQILDVDVEAETIEDAEFEIVE